jgi:hypothetical protein
LPGQSRTRLFGESLSIDEAAEEAVGNKKSYLVLVWRLRREIIELYEIKQSLFSIFVFQIFRFTGTHPSRNGIRKMLEDDPREIIFKKLNPATYFYMNFLFKKHTE